MFACGKAFSMVAQETFWPHTMPLATQPRHPCCLLLLVTACWSLWLLAFGSWLLAPPCASFDPPFSLFVPCLFPSCSLRVPLLLSSCCFLFPSCSLLVPFLFPYCCLLVAFLLLLVPFLFPSCSLLVATRGFWILASCF